MENKNMTKNNGLGNEKELDYRKIAKIVGTLFIIATVTALISVVFMGTTLNTPLDLNAVSANETSLVVSVIFWLILSVSIMGIGVYMYPILKKQNECLALGYASLRLVETIFIIIASLSLLSLVTLSKEYSTAGLDAVYYQVSSSLLMALFNWSFIIGTMIFLGLGGILLYYQMYKSRMVPRWLSAWGLIGAVLVLLYGILSLFGHDPSILAAPIGLQEMVFAAWLIMKGFNTPSITSEC